MLTLGHYARTAESHRVKALYADNVHEQMHWDAEAYRFAQLAEMEQTNPEAARAAYRPTRAYNPDMPHVRDYGNQIEVTTAEHGAALLDRNKLETAWLVRLEHTSRVDLAVALRDQHGFAPDSIRYAIAADALVNANINL